ncbi:hypothetical protein BCR42DRAFT_401194 [Absidia repens]|uniref:CLIP1 zinc knuckle domain-containing protein n=1 Tax=Absidia repens TaxID=90262 RepID=A0A1X2J258_9FUNG|nr:hypothetical protein BCR42DRAFT_401194 [Absidia repens]
METGLFILASKVAPLTESNSCSSSSAAQSAVVVPKKSLTSTRSTTSTSQHRGTKTPSLNETSINRRPRQRCGSHDQQSTPLTSSPSLKKKALSTSSSTKTPRTQPTVTSTLSTRKPTATKSTITSTKLTSSQRKSTTPVLSSSHNSHRQHQQQPQVSKSTRRTVTPTTTKKRNSTSTTAPIKPGGPETLRKSKSTSTRQVVTKEELNKMHVLLEQSRQEKQRLSEEMNGKEAVWERLVTAKESYALKVQDMQVEITRLQDALHISQQQTTALESQLHSKLSTTRSSSPATQSVEGGSMMIMDQQNIRRIEKLDRLVREWQQDAQESHQQMQQQQRAHAAQVDQLRRDLAERDQATATMERECESAKQANVDTIRHYESTMAQWTSDHNRALKSKDDDIYRLEQVIEELKSCHFLLPPSPNNEEEDDEAVTGITDLNKITAAAAAATSAVDGSKMYSSRRRLEQQLEITTLALDDLQQQHRATTMENDQLREKLSLVHAASSAADGQFRQLQKELEVEINDKRLVMEERDAGIQHQLRMEDEYKDLAMTNTRLEHQLNQLTERLEQLQAQLTSTQHAHDAMEKECGRLMDDIVDLEEQLVKDADSDGSIEVTRLKQQLRRLQQQLDSTEAAHRTKLSQLHTDMAQLESLVEKKEFKILELKELYHAEQRRRKQPSSLQQKKKRRQSNSSTTTCSGIIMPLSPISDTASSVTSDTFSTRLDSTDTLYCEICEIHGHDVIGCTALLTDSSRNPQDFSKDIGSMYCVNCDIFNAHATTDCPNQDESF